MATTRTILPTEADLDRLLRASGLITLPPSDAVQELDYTDAIGSATREWEQETGYTPFLAATQTRVYDPPGPERGPVGIYVGVSNVGGGRRLFVYSGLVSVSSVYVGQSTSSTTLAGTISGTTTVGAFAGTYTGTFGTGTFTGTGTGTVTDGVHSGVLTFTISATGNGPTTISGTVTGSVSGATTGAVTLTGTTVSLGTLLTQNIDYWLRPQNAPNFNRPYTYIEFAVPQWGNPQSIRMTGVYGFSQTIPEDAWQAILYCAGLTLLPSLEVQAHQGMESVKLGEDTFQFVRGGHIYKAMSDAWQARVSKTLGRYKRVNIL